MRLSKDDINNATQKASNKPTVKVEAKYLCTDGTEVFESLPNAAGHCLITHESKKYYVLVNHLDRLYQPDKNTYHVESVRTAKEKGKGNSLYKFILVKQASYSFYKDYLKTRDIKYLQEAQRNI